MNKNLKKFLTIISIGAAAVVGFAACTSEGSQNNGGSHEHTFDKTTWDYNSEYHWHPATCEHESATGNRAKHSFTEELLGEADCTTGGAIKRTCACGYSDVIESSPLGHDLKEIPAKAPGCETDGHTAYFVCTRGDYAETPLVIRKTGQHRYDETTWEYNGETHWHPNLCGCSRVLGESGHDINDEGVCSVCGYDPSEELPIPFILEANGSGGYVVAGLSEYGKTESVIEIPANYGSRAITAIKDFAFEDETGIIEVILPASVTSIGREAFSGCTSLESVTFANGLESIGYAAFLNCTSLKAAALPASVRTLEAYAFEGCSLLKSVELPKGLTKLGEQAFARSGIEAIAIPTGITVIGNNTFQNCASLAEVTLHSGVTKIGDNAFARCVSLTEINLYSVGHIGQNAFRGSGLTAVTVPASVSSLNVSAFAECVSLKSAEVLAGINYHFGNLFAGCSSLEELTLPFVGANVSAADALTTEFGYAFGTAKPADEENFTLVGKYYVPNTLKTVKVLGGSVEEGAFDGCSMLEKIDVGASVNVKTFEFENCTAIFYREGVQIVPEVTGVSFPETAVEIETEITLSYVATQGSKLTFSVTKDGAEASDADYVRSGNVFTFKTAGEYVVTVKATLNGTTAEGSASITVELQGPTLEGVELSAATAGKGQSVTLTYEASEGSAIEIIVLKNDAAASEGSDYTYDPATKTFVFNTTGEFTVTVKATLNNKSKEVSKSIIIVDPEAAKPSVELTASSSTVDEGSGVTLIPDVTYADGDSSARETYEVFVETSGGSYENADASLYKLEGTTFTPLVAGKYKIVLTALGVLGGSDSAETVVTANAVDVSLSVSDALFTNGWVRRELSGGAAIVYAVEGYAGGYNVAVTSDFEGAQGQIDGTSLTVSASESYTVIYTVTYTHKTADKSFTLEIPVSFVTSLESSPVLGEDPFGGTYYKLLPGTGMMLYFDVTDQGGSQLTYDDVSYTIVSHEFNTSKNVSIGNVNGQAEYPFILVEDFDEHNHTTSGTVVVKLLATKNGQTTVAVKTFTVEPLAGNGASDSNKGLNAYLDEAYPGTRGALDMDIIMEFGHRDNAVLSKDGIFIHRAAADSWSPGGNMIAVTPEGDGAFADNFQLDFEYTIIKRLSYGGKQTKSSFAVNYRTGSWGGWNSNQTAFYAENSDETISANSWGDNDNAKWEDEQTGKPSAAEGTHVYIRLVHTVEGDRVYFTWTWSYDGTSYNPWYSYNVAKATNEGAMGSPIYALQIGYEGGTYRLGNFKLSDPTLGPADKPEVSLGVNGEATVKEGSSVELNASVQYDTNDTKKSETYTVYVQKDGGSFENADASLYELNGTTFKPLLAGTYKIVLTAVGTRGGENSAEVIVTAEAQDVTLALADGQLTNGWVRRELTGGADIGIDVTGYAGGYNVAVTSDFEGASGQANGTAAISITSSESYTVTFTVTYTHKVAADKSFTLEIPVSFVTSLENSPILGEDPFGGTYDKLLSSFGSQLYFNVTDGNAQLTYEDIEYEVISASLTMGNGVEINDRAHVYTVADNAAYPYLIVENFSGGSNDGDNGNTAKGTITVKLTATKNGAVAVATKVFTVTSLGDKASSSGMNAFYDAAYPNARGDMDMDVIMEIGNRENAVMSKEGVFVHRSGADWDPASNIFCVSPNGKDNFQVDFDYTIIKRNNENNKTSFVVNFRTGSWDGWCGDQTSFYAENSDTSTTAGYWGASSDGTQWSSDKPDAEVGKVIHVRLTHTVDDNKATFNWQWSYDGQDWHEWIKFNPATSSTNGNIGAPVYSLQFRHEKGCFRIGNVKLTDLG